jgi:hypothetical protein
MKRTVIFALIAASCLTSACGKDSKKSEPKATIIHSETGDGVCVQAIKEEADALGLVLNGASPGNCPDKTTLDSGEAVSRYATCPVTTEEGLKATLVYYSKTLNDDGEVIDMTLFSPQALCSIAAQQ